MPLPDRYHTLESVLKHPSRRAGFTLIEMAVALVVLTLVLGSLLAPLTSQVEQRKISEAQKILDQINDALMGFAMSQATARLPCPDTDGDGQENACADSNLSNATGGNIPWVTLGVPATDPWGQRYRYRVNNAYGTQIVLTPPMAPSGNGALRVCAETACATLLATNVPAVVYSLGPNGAQAPSSPDETENTNNDRTFVSRTFSSATGAEFDDVVTWISAPLLLNRLVNASKL